MNFENPTKQDHTPVRMDIIKNDNGQKKKKNVGENMGKEGAKVWTGSPTVEISVYFSKTKNKCYMFQLYHS